MSSGIRATLIGCALFIALVLGLFVNSILRQPGLSDDQLREDHGTVVLPQARAPSPFRLVSQDGTPFTDADLRGQWTFAYFGFTHCPDICPVTLAVLAEARRQLLEAAEREPFDVVLFTVDPERDTPEVLAEFVRYFDPEFVGATGERADIAALAREVSVAFAKVPSEQEPDGYVVDHTGNIVIFNPRGHYHGYIRLPHTPDRVLTAYRTLADRS
ncbi:MAG: SCO family protein [Gammaproteobacteria bacterium]|nr:MAG: SCO family protein [Gammaproteobacteria bacterium]